MIQRIQTLFLLAISILSVTLLFIPFQSGVVSDVHFTLSLMPGRPAEWVKPLIYVPTIVNMVVLLLSLICIFQYKNRKLQMKFCIVILVLSAALINNLLNVDYRINAQPGSFPNHNIAAFFPIANVVLALLARLFIKKDDDLVRSADRIR